MSTRAGLGTVGQPTTTVMAMVAKPNVRGTPPRPRSVGSRTRSQPAAIMASLAGVVTTPVYRRKANRARTVKWTAAPACRPRAATMFATPVSRTSTALVIARNRVVATVAMTHATLTKTVTLAQRTACS
jgi:hypothetical protein